MEEALGLEKTNRTPIPFANLPTTVTLTSRPVEVTGLPPGFKIYLDGGRNVLPEGQTASFAYGDGAFQVRLENSKLTIRATQGNTQFEYSTAQVDGKLRMFIGIRNSAQ